MGNKHLICPVLFYLSLIFDLDIPQQEGRKDETI